MSELEAVYEMEDGTRLEIRPLKASDEKAWLDFVNGLSPDSLYHRLFQVRKPFSHGDTGHFLEISPEKRTAVVAVTRGKIVAVARYELAPGSKIGEFAIVVGDNYQNKGLGSFLLGILADHAKSKGIEELVAEMFPDNERMLELCRKSGYRMDSKVESDTRIIKLHLQ